MFELITLGGISLRTADMRQTIDLLRYPKQLALLVYLAVEARPATRDELIGLFWPNAAEQRARQSLSRAVSSLRGVVGAEAIITDGNVARRIAPGIVRPDTAVFDAAVHAKQWSEAVTLYHGEFLKGFILPEAREFEDWTSRTRERHRQQAVRVAEARAGQLRAAGDMREAAGVLGRACEIAPEREDIAAAVIEAYADADQALAAVDWFARYTRRFEEIFEESPKPALAARMKQLRAAARSALVPAPLAHEAAAREPVIASIQPGGAGPVLARASIAPTCADHLAASGAAFPRNAPGRDLATRSDDAVRGRDLATQRDPAAPVQDLARKRDDVEPGPAARGSVRDPSGIRSRLRFPRRPLWSRATVLATMGVVSALVGTIWLGVGDTVKAEPRVRPTTMLISMVNRTPDIGWRHLAQSLEETLAARMSNPPRLYVTVRQDVTGATQGARSRAETAPPALRHDVDFMLAGTVHQTAERVRIELRVFDGVSNRAIRNVRVNRRRGDVFALLDETTQELADTLRPLLGSAIGSRRARSRTTSTAAWSDLEHSKALLADARRFIVRGGSAQAAALLELADSLTRRAIQTDPAWVDARYQLAQIERSRSIVRLTSAPPDRSAAAKHLADASGILYDASRRWPDKVRVHELAGTVSYERWVVVRPRDKAERLLDEAVRSLERAILLDPYAARPWVTLSDVHAAQGDHAASAVAAQQALERDAFAEYTDELHNRLFHAYFELRQDEVAARWCDEINRRGPGRVLGAFCELNLQGWSSIREPDLAAADLLIENLDADPPAFAAMMKPRLRMLQAAVAARQGETKTARRLLDDAVAATRRTDGVQAAIFHAAALVRLGELDAARNVLDERTHAREHRIAVDRWFHELDESGRLVP